MSQHVWGLARAVVTVLAVIFLPRVLYARERWTAEFSGELEFGAGYLHGEGTLAEAGAFFHLESKLVPTIRFQRRVFVISLPLQLDSRTTPTVFLSKHQIQGGPKLSWRPDKRLELGGTGALFETLKPDWPDEYQPEPDASEGLTGELLPTDRHSNHGFEVQGYLDWRMHKKYDVELYGVYGERHYINDPNYNPADNPTHLVPADKKETQVGVTFTGREFSRRWRHSLNVQTTFSRYPYTYSRDAGTGLTHAGEGGPPANPAERFLNLRVRHRSRVKLWPRVLQMVVVLSVTRNWDLYDDYYTWNQVDWFVQWKVTPHRRLELKLAYGGHIRVSTPKGYQFGAGHPPLEGGDSIQKERFHRITARTEWIPFLNDVGIFIEGEWKIQRDNFPDYEPWVFPSSRGYQINWDYMNWQTIAGAFAEF